MRPVLFYRARVILLAPSAWRECEEFYAVEQESLIELRE
jgi:hypothetical protein